MGQGQRRMSEGRSPRQVGRGLTTAWCTNERERTAVIFMHGQQANRQRGSPREPAPEQPCVPDNVRAVTSPFGSSTPDFSSGLVGNPEAGKNFPLRSGLDVPERARWKGLRRKPPGRSRGPAAQHPEGRAKRRPRDRGKPKGRNGTMSKKKKRTAA